MPVWSRDPWAGRDPAGAKPNSQVLPPPIPGGTTSYVTYAASFDLPWALGPWGGAALPVVTRLGGLIVVPDDDEAITTVWAWWPSTSAMRIVRINADGTRSPVRGAYPLEINDRTRTNLCPNPTARSGLNGYVPGVGSPTLSVVTRPDNADTAWRATIASAGTCEVTAPHSIPSASTVTVGIDLRFSARPTSATITVGWADAAGNALTSSVITLSANQINASVAQFARQFGTAAPPVGAVSCTTVKIAAGGLPAGGYLDGSHVTLEVGPSDGSYFDGDTRGGLWTGTPELSTSLLAPVQQVRDGECPLDQPVHYVVYGAGFPGGYAVSPTVQLNSRNRSWLTHPAQPGAPMRCRPTRTPKLTRPLQQGVFAVIGRPRPVVVSASTRQAPNGTLELDTPTFAERDALLELLADGQPLLLRAPADYGYGAGMWISLGDLDEDPGDRPAWVQGRALSAPFQVVDPPASEDLVVA